MLQINFMKRSLLVLLLVFSVSIAAEDEESPVSGDEFMASTANPQATEVASDILKRGGSAIDAAIAVQMVLTLVEPEASGIGGGAFALYWDQQKRRLHSFDGRETAPAAVSPELFIEDGEPMDWWQALAGGRAVGVPGVVPMLEMMHKRFGRLPWAELFEPAIKLAEDGFVVTRSLAEGVAEKINPALGKYEDAKEYFWPGGEPLKAGQVQRNPQLAESLRLIAKRGSRGLLEGSLAEEMVAKVQGATGNPGELSLNDLERYQAKERRSVCSSYRQYRVCGMGPPSSGGVTVLQILGLLENFELKNHYALSASAIHIYTQAARLAYADRNRYLADSDFVDVPVRGLLDKNYLKKRAKLINYERDMGMAEAGSPPGAPRARIESSSPARPSTSHFSIIDSEGSAISMTSSIEMAFGSTLMAGGFLLNNQLTDFSFTPEVGGEKVANRVEAGKRPRSSMAPMMVFNRQGKLVYIIGSPGGSRIINYVARTLVALIDWGMDIQQAVNLPLYMNRNGVTEVETGREMGPVATTLESMGHEVKFTAFNSGLYGISIAEDGTLYGGADHRREGVAMGE